MLITCVTSFNLTILHTNDVHAHYDEINTFSGQCNDPGNCYGGMARLKYKVDEIKRLYPKNTLFLDAGDQYQGTFWFSEFGGTIVHTYMNLLEYDAMALGNHEFDDDIERLLPPVEKSDNFKVLSCNIDAPGEPMIQNKFHKSVILDIDGEKIGIVGYTTKKTPILSNPGTPPSNDNAVDVYPTVVINNNGDEVLVVQDYAFAKYLGFLQVEFDNNGKIIRYNGNPILLDNSIPNNRQLENVTNDFGKGLRARMNNVIGRTLVFLNGGRFVCRLQECNLGNLIADGMVHQNLLHADSVDGAKVFISIVNSGAIRSSIEREVSPFRNTIDTIKLRGDYLLQALEHSVADYDIDGPVGATNIQCNMIISAYSKTLTCNVTLKTLKLNDDWCNVIRDLEADVLIEYIKNVSPFYNGIEGRIIMDHSTETIDSLTCNDGKVIACDDVTDSTNTCDSLTCEDGNVLTCAGVINSKQYKYSRRATQKQRKQKRTKNAICLRNKSRNMARMNINYADIMRFLKRNYY
ncbi:NT5E [Mytilus coruscus]|uniref:5'-nucleotidase n=1 Tax=Mytilus coruscus TaxID=42192 RepID=A0A6J8A8B0_MYTCO|nr:NT5E [Mytilus coruscus]